MGTPVAEAFLHCWRMFTIGIRKGHLAWLFTGSTPRIPRGDRGILHDVPSKTLGASHSDAGRAGAHQRQPTVSAEAGGTCTRTLEAPQAAPNMTHTHTRTHMITDAQARHFSFNVGSCDLKPWIAFRGAVLESGLKRAQSAGFLRPPARGRAGSSGTRLRRRRLGLGLGLRIQGVPF